MISPCPAGRSGLSQETVTSSDGQEGKVLASINPHATALMENSADFVVNKTMTRGIPIKDLLPPDGNYNLFALNNEHILFDMPQGIYYLTGNVISTLSENHEERRIDHTLDDDRARTWDEYISAHEGEGHEHDQLLAHWEQLPTYQENFMVYKIVHKKAVHLRKVPSCAEQFKAESILQPGEEFRVGKAADVDGRFFLGLADESGWIAEEGCTKAVKDKALAVTSTETTIPVYYRFQADGNNLELDYGAERVASMSSEGQPDGSLELKRINPTFFEEFQDYEGYQEGIWAARTR
mmetsp:Transcript_102425/g.187041  ORF Transcript_102425/g.187041 Transcript_102425/m.187041 type:complete len:294 (-) Transcript_102425:257-1138(-)